MTCEDDECMDDAERRITYRDGKTKKEEFLCEVHAAPRLVHLQNTGMNSIEIEDWDDPDEDEDEDDPDFEDEDEDGDEA